MTDTITLDRDWLIDWANRMVGEDGPVSPDEDLTLYGLDSIAVMRLVLLLEERGIVVSFADLAEQPTIDAWAGLIAARLH